MHFTSFRHFSEKTNAHNYEIAIVCFFYLTMCHKLQLAGALAGVDHRWSVGRGTSTKTEREIRGSGGVASRHGGSPERTRDGELRVDGVRRRP